VRGCDASPALDARNALLRDPDPRVRLGGAACGTNVARAGK